MKRHLEGLPPPMRGRAKVPHKLTAEVMQLLQEMRSVAMLVAPMCFGAAAIALHGQWR